MDGEILSPLPTIGFAAAFLPRVVHRALQDGEHNAEARLPEYDVDADLAASSDFSWPEFLQ